MINFKENIQVYNKIMIQELLLKRNNNNQKLILFNLYNKSLKAYIYYIYVQEIHILIDISIIKLTPLK